MADLTPDLASKLLATDLRNIVKKVAEGGTMSTAERETMERALLTGEISAELQQARQAALIRKWANGGKLNQDELLEMGSVIPDGRQIANKDAEGKIKKWVKKGRYNEDGSLRDPLDLPPFDQLDKLAEWWRRHMKWRVPDFILSFEQGEPAAAQAPAQPGVKATSEPASKTTPEASHYNGMTLDGVGSGDQKADMGLQQARRLVEATYSQMERALEGKRFTEFTTLENKWRGLNNTLRAWEKDIVKIQLERGETLRTRELLEDANRMFSMLAISFMNCLEEQYQRLSPTTPPPERKEQILVLRDTIFEHLQKTRFATAWVPPEEIAA